VPNAVRALVVAGDPRRIPVGASVESITNQQSEIRHTQFIDPECAPFLISSWVSMAVEKGYLATSLEAEPLAAYTYAVRIINTAISGGVVLAQKVPRWMAHLMAALRPKDCAMDLGKVAYSTVGAIADALPADYLTGPLPGSGDWLIYVKGNGSADGFPEAISSGSVIVDLQEPAFQALCNVFASQKYSDSRGYWNEMVNPSEKNSEDNNVSMYSWQVNRLGVGATGQGGWGFVLNHEVPIFTPIFGAFGSLNTTAENVDINRFPRFSHPFAGDLCQIVPIMSQLSTNRKHWSFKRSPKYHFVDFNEFGDVLANWVTQLQSAATVGPGGITVMDADLICPLTLQETLLLLRNEILYAFGYGHICGQFLSPSVSGVNPFIPFKCGTNCAPSGPVGMQLPLPLVENVRSLISRCVHKSAVDIEWFFSVLGIFKNDLLVQSEYTYKRADSEPSPSFTTLSDVRRVKLNQSKGSSFKPEVEIPLSLVDGSSGSTYYFINDQSRLKELAASWNKWTSSWNAYSSSLTTLSTEKGISILESASCTLHFSQANTAMEQRIANTEDLRAKAVTLSSVYADRTAAAISQKGTFLNGPTEQALAIWILPVSRIDLGIQSPQSASVFPRIQDLLSEPFVFVMTSTGVDGQIMANRHAAYASKMIKGVAAQPNDWDEFFKTMAASGRGGILTSLVAGLATKFLGPTVGGVASSLADILPI